jgi:hypothetical protein
MEIRVSAAGQVDLADYASLQKRAFAEVFASAAVSDAHLDAAFFGWKYRPPAGEAKLAIAYLDGKMVASSAMVPCRVVTTGGKRALGWQVGDVVTAPEVRGRGLFQGTLQALLAAVKDDEVPFAYPNARSMQAFVKIGWREFDLVATFEARLWRRGATAGCHGAGRTRCRPYDAFYRRGWPPVTPISRCSREPTPMCHGDSAHPEQP